ncbi:hypothetical protein [uncultured Psychroserpens sp.]|uniref:hypothetical protein n=1 Tax=uncultured Psychroserpens sp. TaxID=255436 RepID=UPI0026243089|nr:hypothetical protein [uncultured Psychroserpens sp.]
MEDKSIIKKTADTITKSTNQEWKGSFTYLEGYETIQQYIDVEFTLEIDITNNSFIGISSDSESKDLFDKPATVKGFIDENKISFVMNYPCLYYKDETGTMRLDQSSEHPDIHYLGFFNDDKTQVNGNWEMTLREEKYMDGYLENIANGEFEMRRIN